MTAPSAFRQQPEVRKSKAGLFFPENRTFVAGEPGSDPKSNRISAKRSKHSARKDVSIYRICLRHFQIISICFPTLHLLLGFRRLKEKDYSLVVLPEADKSELTEREPHALITHLFIPIASRHRHYDSLQRHLISKTKIANPQGRRFYPFSASIGRK